MQCLRPECVQPIDLDRESRTRQVRRHGAVMLRTGKRPVTGQWAAKFGDGDVLAGPQPILGRPAHIQPHAKAKRENDDASNKQPDEHVAEHPRIPVCRRYGGSRRAKSCWTGEWSRTLRGSMTRELTPAAEEFAGGG